jgi:hypothetical protein
MARTIASRYLPFYRPSGGLKVSRGIDIERSEFDMERSENAALDSSTPSEPQFDCLANSLVQLLETAKYRSNTGGSKQQSHWRRQLVHEVRKVLLPERRKIIAVVG